MVVFCPGPYNQELKRERENGDRGKRPLRQTQFHIFTVIKITSAKMYRPTVKPVLTLNQ